MFHPYKATPNDKPAAEPRGPNPDAVLRDAIDRGKREPAMVKTGEPKAPADVIDPGKRVKR